MTRIATGKDLLQISDSQNYGSHLATALRLLHCTHWMPHMLLLALCVAAALICHALQRTMYCNHTAKLNAIISGSAATGLSIVLLHVHDSNNHLKLHHPEVAPSICNRCCNDACARPRLNCFLFHRQSSGNQPQEQQANRQFATCHVSPANSGVFAS